MKAIARSPQAPLAAVVVMALALGVLLGNDYGMGWDEYANAGVGRQALQSYTSPDAYRAFLERENLGHHGPSYFMALSLVETNLTALLPGWHPADARHFTNYLTFLMAGISLYCLCLRMLPKSVAFVTTACFLTQPLLFGHAFINQKDVPFMAFFLATIVVGLSAADRLARGARGAPGQEAPQPGLRSRLVLDLQARGSGWQVAFAIWLALFSWLMLDILVSGGILEAARTLLSLAHARQAWEPLNGLYATLAEDSVKLGVAVYHAKLELAYYVLGRPMLFLVALAGGVETGRRGFPQVGRGLFPGNWGAYALLILSGLLLGLTISIRPLAVLAGLLVTGYMVHRLRWGAVGPILVLGVVAGLSSYLTWPWLWPAPIDRFVESVRYTADFENKKSVLFRGQFYPSEATPWDYLPVLLAVQLTEPVIPIFLVGLVVAAVDAHRNPEHRPVAFVVLTWFLVVTVAYVFPGSVHYDNFRHLLFVLPAVFVIFGFGLHLLFSRVRRRPLRVLLVGALLFSGVRGIVQLHPYEYVYYNSLTGGVEGAQRSFPLDYWCTSYRDAMRYVNSVAETGARVMAMEPVQPARSFARDDLQVVRNDGGLNVTGVDFLLACGRWLGQDWGEAARLEEVHTVGRDSAVFAEVFRRADVTPGASE